MEQIASVRNATQAAKVFASSSAGQLARIEGLVAVGCILVGILVVSNSRRRHDSRSLARLVVWGAFMFNFPVISYTIGLMQSSPIKNELFVVWACFLVLLLGSADTMTAFSFNDSSQQTRSMMHQALHTIYLLFLMLYYKGQLRSNFLISLFLLWGLSVVRLGLRGKAYRSTCRSRGLIRENQVVMDYMKNEPLHSPSIRLGNGTYNPTTMEGYIYLVDGKEVKKVKSGEEVIQVAYRGKNVEVAKLEPAVPETTVDIAGIEPAVPEATVDIAETETETVYVAETEPDGIETVDVARIWQCKGKLLQCSSNQGGASRRRDLCLSFALFRLLRLRFAVDHVGSISFPFQETKCRDFVIKGLLSDDEDLDRAFRVVEAELGFLFDFFYARYPSIKDTLAPDSIVYALILATSIFTLFCPDLLRYQPPMGGTNIFVHGFNLDLLVTRLVIVWYMFLESYQFLSLFIFSDWHKVKMMCRYVRKESWHRAFVEIPLKVLCHFNITKYWKGSIGQYFILDNVHPHPVKSFLSWLSLQALDASLMTSSISLPPEVRHAVLRQLKATRCEITDGRMWLYGMGVMDLDLDKDCFLGHTYACYIMTWHVATSICSYGLTVEDASSPELVKNHAVATKLSGYCAYLLAFKPDLVPDSTYTSLSMAHGTLQNAREYLAECKSNKEMYDKLIELGNSRSKVNEVRFLHEGARIAVYLVDSTRIETEEERWRVLAVFWANMMLWIASSDRAVAHATRMATGGEFITLIWALLTHAHVVDKIQGPSGAPGLHMQLPSDSDDSDSSSTDESIYSTDDESEPDGKESQMTMRGPCIRGDASFDEHYIFANNMELTRNQLRTLENLVNKDSPGERMKYYVYKMTNSSVIPNNCKMEFGVEFTNANLKRYLGQPIEIHVECTTSKEKAIIRIKMEQGTNKAIITSGWPNAVKRYLIEEEDIYIFIFYPEIVSVMLVPLD
uniref:Uncharacterized protein n=1 Tax=Avena sativa TaxID=4498 RepID=A0ACD5W6R1_AVESA